MQDSKISTQVPQAFPHTRWSVVVAAQDGDSKEAAQALEILCRTYWYPLYAFVRRMGRSPEDAQDLTQAFFARMLEKEYLDAVVREKGRFRSFLLMALKRFLANQWEHDHAAKRGGGRTFLPLDTELAERRYLGEGADHIPPDRIYEHRWALTLVERAFARLKTEFEDSNRSPEFEQMKQWLTAARGEIPYEQVAAALGTNESSARVSVHRMRKRFREVFREEIAATVASAEEVEDEVRYLRKVLAG